LEKNVAGAVEYVELLHQSNYYVKLLRLHNKVVIHDNQDADKKWRFVMKIRLDSS